MEKIDQIEVTDTKKFQTVVSCENMEEMYSINIEKDVTNSSCNYLLDDDHINQLGYNNISDNSNRKSATNQNNFSDISKNLQ